MVYLTQAHKDTYICPKEYINIGLGSVSKSYMYIVVKFSTNMSVQIKIFINSKS